MGYRNIILIGALVLGIAIVVLMYVRRGFNDIQEQIDAIETVLAGMPPTLTSGAWAGAAQGGGAPVPPPAAPVPTEEEPAEYYNLDEDVEDNDEEELIETLIDTDMSEYDLSGNETTGIATLSEPGYYEAGGMYLTVTPVGSGEEDEHDTRFVVSELEPLTGMLPPSMQEEDEDGLGLGAVSTTESDGESDGDAEADTEDNVASEEEAGVGADTTEAVGVVMDDTAVKSADEEADEVDEFAQMTLPELKARLKVLQPETKGLARLKRAEVLDRLRSGVVVEVDSEK